jgi:hypothetical protein
MNRLQQYEKYKEYIEINQLGKLINIQENIDFQEQISSENTIY